MSAEWINVSKGTHWDALTWQHGTEVLGSDCMVRNLDITLLTTLSYSNSLHLHFLLCKVR